MKPFVLLIALSAVIIKTTCQSNGKNDDAIGYMLSNEDENNKQTGLIYMPSKCPRNQVMFPIEGGKEYMCDCAPGAVYYPQDETCYQPYRQGPCRKGQILKMPNSDTNRVPFCANNNCENPKQVKYRKTCWEIGKRGGPCGSKVLRIDSKTYQLKCKKSNDQHKKQKIPAKKVSDYARHN